MVSCCVNGKPLKSMQHMHGNIPLMFDCWADPIFHMLLLKNSLAWLLRPLGHPEYLKTGALLKVKLYENGNISCLQKMIYFPFDHSLRVHLGKSRSVKNIALALEFVLLCF